MARLVAKVSHASSLASLERVNHPFGGHPEKGLLEGRVISSSVVQFLLAGGHSGMHPNFNRASALVGKSEGARTVINWRRGVGL